MGLLLKIALLGVALYGVWKTYRHWKGLFDRFVGPPPVPKKPEQPPVPPAPEAGAARTAVHARPPVIEEALPCRVCGAYLSSGAAKCGRTDCPLP